MCHNASTMTRKIYDMDSKQLMMTHRVTHAGEDPNWAPWEPFDKEKLREHFLEDEDAIFILGYVDVKTETTNGSLDDTNDQFGAEMPRHSVELFNNYNFDHLRRWYVIETVRLETVGDSEFRNFDAAVSAALNILKSGPLS